MVKEAFNQHEDLGRMMRTIWLAGVATALLLGAGCETSSDDAPGAYWNAQDGAAAPAANTASTAAA